MGADFDIIDVNHDCPKCKRNLLFYQTGQLGGTMGTYRIGDPINTGHGTDFEFGLFDYCDPCGVTIEGTGFVRQNRLTEIRERGYRDERAEPISLPEKSFSQPVYWNLPFFGRIKVADKMITPKEKPFTEIPRIIAQSV